MLSPPHRVTPRSRLRYEIADPEGLNISPSQLTIEPCAEFSVSRRARAVRTGRRITCMSHNLATGYYDAMARHLGCSLRRCRSHFPPVPPPPVSSNENELCGLGVRFHTWIYKLGTMCVIISLAQLQVSVYFHRCANYYCEYGRFHLILAYDPSKSTAWSPFNVRAFLVKPANRSWNTFTCATAYVFIYLHNIFVHPRPDVTFTNSAPRDRSQCEIGGIACLS